MTQPAFGTCPPRPTGPAGAIRRTAATLAWLIGLLSGLGLAGSPTWALARDALTPAAIAEFQSKLDAARAAQGVVAERVACFEREDAALVKERDEDQRRLGELVGSRRDLEVRVEQQRAEYEGFRRIYDEESERLFQANRELARLRAIQRANEEKLRSCKRSFWIFSFMCDLSKEIAMATGLMQQTDGQIAVATRRMNDANAGMTRANDNFRQSAEALATTERDAARTEQEIRTAEASLVRLHRTLATLRPEVHDSKVLLDDFAGALDEARGDGRAQSARRVRTLAGQVDDATRRSNTLLDHARTVLPEQQFAACFR